MSTPAPSVRRIGAGVSYADGAEDDVLSVLRTVTDRSSGSPELAARIVDWPTRYHFSYQRTNLLRPLDIGPGVRVLDVGAGTGVAARYLGEQGATVVALEGNPARAEAAATRCADLPDVEVLCGALDDLDPGQHFDVVLLIGVLEYAGSAKGGSGGAPAMLQRARSHLAPGGSVIVAIENQLGLKYLLGGREDHLGQPWVGIEGYSGPPGTRTWSRRVLAAMLRDAGFDAQHWLAPFPDYKLPTVVLDGQLYDQPDVAGLLDQLVLQPVAFHDQPPVRLADASAAHRAFADAGLAADVANSFLVIASSSGEDGPRRVRTDVLAWMFGGHRRSPWRRARVLTTGRTVERLDDDGVRGEGWLMQDPGERVRPFYGGRTLGEQALSAVRDHDLDGLGAVLRTWAGELEARAVDVGPEEAGSHPFLPPGSRRGLPDGYLDASLTNFVVQDDRLILIDDEWRTGHPVELDIARFRAMWVLAREIIGLGIEHSWGDWATVDDVVAALVDLAGLTVDPHTVEQWREAEIALQELVAGEPRERLLTGWLDGSLRSVDLRADAQHAEEPHWSRGEAIAGLGAALDQRTAQLEAARAELDAATAERDAAVAERDHLQHLVDQQQHAIARLRTPRGWVADALRRPPRLRRALRTVRRTLGSRSWLRGWVGPRSPT